MEVPGAFMKIMNEASRLFLAIFALILAAMLTTPSSLIHSADMVLAKSKTNKTETKSSSPKKEKMAKNKKYNKTLADLF